MKKKIKHGLWMVFLSGEGPCFWARLSLLLLLTALFQGLYLESQPETAAREGYDVLRFFWLILLALELRHLLVRDGFSDRLRTFRERVRGLLFGAWKKGIAIFSRAFQKMRGQGGKVYIRGYQDEKIPLPPEELQKKRKRKWKSYKKMDPGEKIRYHYCRWLLRLERAGEEISDADTPREIFDRQRGERERAEGEALLPLYEPVRYQPGYQAGEEQVRALTQKSRG